MLLHKSLIKFSREGAYSKKSQRKEGRNRHEHSALGQFGTYQVKTHAQYFAKLVTLAVMPSKRSNVARSMKSNNVNLLGVAQRNTISIMNTAVKVLTDELNIIVDKKKVYEVLLLTREAKEKVIHVFHNTIMRARDGGGMNSKEGLLECRRIFKAELDELISSNNEHDQIALQYLKTLDLPSGSKGGRPVLFNVCPTYEKTVSSRVNLFTDGVFSEGEYRNNVGYGVHLSYALLHIMTSVKNKAIIPQKVDRSLLVIIPSNTPVIHDACIDTLRTSQLSYFDEVGYNNFKAAQSITRVSEPIKMSQVLSEEDFAFARDNFVSNDKVKFLIDTVYTQQSRAASRVLNCLSAVEEVDIVDITYARGYGETFNHSFIHSFNASYYMITTCFTMYFNFILLFIAFILAKCSMKRKTDTRFKYFSQTMSI